MSVETVKTSEKEETSATSSPKIQEPPAKKIKSSQSQEDIILKPKRVPSAGENAAGFIKKKQKILRIERSRS